MTIPIREAIPEDASGIAQVHIQSWQTSYRGMVPDEVLDNLSIKRREGYWQQITSGSEILHFVFVAENEQEEVVGFASGGRSRQESLPFAGELYAIYLLEAYKRQGIGIKLFQAAIERLIVEGIDSMMLWVLADNYPARRFYEKMAGKYVTEQTITIGGKELLEVAYGWDKLEN
jgi:ribosomal protein S18 acetylase RimI-like enzyme